MSAPHASTPLLARAVALGGGHGQARTLRALVHVAAHVTAIATVADDGGSSGRLRRDLGVLPPGDLRMAMSALSTRPDLEALLEYRFAAGELEGHSLGNLIMVALQDIEGGVVPGLDRLTSLLGLGHRVLPSTTANLDLAGTGPDGPIVGQAAIAGTVGVRDLRLVGEDPVVAPEAAEAIAAAELVVLGPGSVCTSIIPNLLVPGIAAALAGSDAPVVLVANLDEQRGEGEGRGLADHLELIRAAAPDVRIDHVILHEGPVPTSNRPTLVASRALGEGTQGIVRAAVADAAGGHDPAALAQVLRRLVSPDAG